MTVWRKANTSITFRLMSKAARPYRPSRRSYLPGLLLMYLALPHEERICGHIAAAAILHKWETL